MAMIEIIARISAGVALGALIGFERQYRARMAGLRTNTLVALGSALFVLLSAYGFDMNPSSAHADPTRVAAQIVSGIGFLGAGVIMRDGLNVRGLNTAATLWCSAAVGALCGAGLYVIAGIGTVIVLAANIVLRPIGRLIDRQPVKTVETNAHYAFHAVTEESAQLHIRSLLVQALSRTDFQLSSLETNGAAPEGHVEIHAELYGHTRDDDQMETAISRLSLEPQIVRMRWGIVEQRQERETPATTLG